MAAGEFEYYSTRSGLAEGTLADHKRGFFSIATGATGSLADLELAYYRAETGGTGTLADLRAQFYSTAAGRTGDITDLMSEYFLNPDPLGTPVFDAAAGALFSGGAISAAQTLTLYVVCADGTANHRVNIWNGSTVALAGGRNSAGTAWFGLAQESGTARVASAPAPAGPQVVCVTRESLEEVTVRTSDGLFGSWPGMAAWPTTATVDRAFMDTSILYAQLYTGTHTLAQRAGNLGLLKATYL